MLNPLAVAIQQGRHWLVPEATESAAAAIGGGWRLLAPLAIAALVAWMSVWRFRRREDGWPRSLKRFTLLLAFGFALSAAAEASASCDLGRPIAERVLIWPAPDSFYSSHALNPDVVRWRGRYYLFFSGNTVKSPHGVWRTGLAVSRHPAGPFRVTRAPASQFLNGGTIRFSGAFLQAANAWTGLAPVFYRSRNGRAWKRIFQMPVPQPPSWRYWQSDLYLGSASTGF